MIQKRKKKHVPFNRVMNPEVVPPVRITYFHPTKGRRWRTPTPALVRALARALEVRKVAA